MDNGRESSVCVINKIIFVPYLLCSTSFSFCFVLLSFGRPSPPSSEVASIFRFLLFSNGAEVVAVIVEQSRTSFPFFFFRENDVVVPSSLTFLGGGTALNARRLLSKKSNPSLEMTLGDKRHCFMAFRKYSDGVPTFPYGKIK